MNAGSTEPFPPAPKSFWLRYVFSTDHKVIGLQYLFTGLFFFLAAGFLAMLVRWQLAYPWKPVPVVGKLLFPDSQGAMTPEGYLGIMTMHGSFMLLFFIIPTLVGAFGNYLVPLQIGARDMALPRLNMTSYWLLMLAGLLMLASLFVPGGPCMCGWTVYPPLSAAPDAVPSRIGNILWVVSVFLLGWSSILGGLNFVVTIATMRAPGMGYFRMPLTCWSFLLVSIILILATPVIASALVLLLSDQAGLTNIFLPAGLVISDKPLGRSGGGQPLLFQHLFWFYSHPVVYLMVLPGLAMVMDILSVFARKPTFGYRSSVVSLAAVIAIGFVVWGHHMYVSGLNPALGTAFSIVTALIGVPSGVLVFNMLATVWRGSIRLTASMLAAMAVVVIFVTGGLSGLFNAMAAIDVYVHDTYWVVAHFHYVVGGASVFSVFAGLYFWYPKMFGRRLNEFWGRIHVVLSFLAFNAVFFTMHILGIGGHMRRIADPSSYDFLKPYQGGHLFITMAAFALGAVQLIFVVNFLAGLIWGKPAEQNPWNATTLEWATTSPPPHHNYDRLPVVHRWPYEYSPPQWNGRDCVPQHEASASGVPAAP